MDDEDPTSPHLLACPAGRKDDARCICAKLLGIDEPETTTGFLSNDHWLGDPSRDEAGCV